MSSRPEKSALFADDFKPEPYWWDTADPVTDDPGPLPEKVDVAVVGGGYTGLNTAIQVGRAGRGTLVLDAEEAGWGCSSRNGGQVSTSLKPGYDELCRRYGAERGRVVFAEGGNSLEWFREFATRENLDCDFRPCGRFHAAHNSAQYSRLARDAEISARDHGTGATVIGPSDVRTELGTDAYHGGVIFPRHVSVNPARYHRELLRLAREAGADVRGRAPVTAIQREGGEYVLQSARGNVRAKKVVIATNGYTGPLTPWLRRRVIPIGSYIIATEPLPAGLMDRLIPRDRIVSDSRKVVYYYRASPDRQRIVFGGRVSHNETNPRHSAPRLHRELARIFPELSSTRVSHSWMGFVAYTFDTLMHVGNRDGLHYAMGYCGSGVGMASYLGMRMGQQVLGLDEGRTGFDDLPFPTRPLYTGRPWFLAPSVMFYRFRDSLNI